MITPLSDAELARLERLTIVDGWLRPNELRGVFATIAALKAEVSSLEALVARSGGRFVEREA